MADIQLFLSFQDCKFLANYEEGAKEFDLVAPFYPEDINSQQVLTLLHTHSHTITYTYYTHPSHTHTHYYYYYYYYNIQHTLSHIPTHTIQFTSMKFLVTDLLMSVLAALNPKQVFKCKTEGIIQLKILFEKSTDFYGRITIYKIDVIGRPSSE